MVRKTGAAPSSLRLAGVSSKAYSCRGLGMRVSRRCQANVFRMVAAVLALGDVDFVERSEARDGDPLSELAEASRPRLEAAASLLHVSPEAILSALISRKINAGISSQVGPVAELGVLRSSVPEIGSHTPKKNTDRSVASS